KRRVALRAAKRLQNSIRFVFFHRQRSRDVGLLRLLGRAAAGSGSLPAVNVLNNLCNHGRGRGTSMHLTADVPFVKRGERVLRLTGGQESAEPCRRALFVFRSPLRRASFPSDLDAIEAG